MAAVNDNSQDFDPRHRIVGAIIVVLLVVVFVPLLLGDPEELSRKAGQPDAGVAAATDSGVKRYVTDLSGGRNVSREAENRSASKQGRIGVSASRSGRKQPPVANRKTPVASGQWEVRIGTFSKPDNAYNLLKGLKRLKFDAKSTKVGNGHVRIWMGVYSSKEEASRMARKLEKLAKVKPIVRQR